MTSAEIIAFWQAHFGVAPGAWHAAEPERTVRVHYLPGGEEFPRHRGQYSQALERLNVVLDHVLGDDEPYVLVVTQYGPRDVAPQIDVTGYEVLREVWDEDEDGGPPYLGCTLFFRELRWRAGSQDAVLRGVIDEEMSAVKLLNTTRGWIALPYPGGIDVVAPRESEADAFRRRFHFWQPFVGEIDAFSVVRAAHPEERDALGVLVSLGGSVYLGEDDRARSLHICSSKVDDAVAESIAQLAGLERLVVGPHAPDVAASRLSDRGVRSLERLTRLASLSLDDEERAVFPEITDIGRGALAALRGRGMAPP